MSQSALQLRHQSHTVKSAKTFLTVYEFVGFFLRQSYTLQALPPKESLGFECGDAQFFWDSVSIGVVGAKNVCTV